MPFEDRTKNPDIEEQSRSLLKYSNPNSKYQSPPLQMSSYEAQGAASYYETPRLIRKNNN